MADHWTSTRRHGDEPVASTTVSRLIILVFVVAILLGLGGGVVWVAWNLLRHQLAG